MSHRSFRSFPQLVMRRHCGWAAGSPNVGSTQTPEKETEMTTASPARCIVVGYDGSPASRAALARAAERAGEDGRIYIVHAYSVPADYARCRQLPTAPRRRAEPRT